ISFYFFFQAEDGIRDKLVTGVQTSALPSYPRASRRGGDRPGRSAGDRQLQHLSGRADGPAPRGGSARSAAAASVDRRAAPRRSEIGRASCRERAESSEGDGAMKQKG